MYPRGQKRYRNVGFKLIRISWLLTTFPIIGGKIVSKKIATLKLGQVAIASKGFNKYHKVTELMNWRN